MICPDDHSHGRTVTCYKTHRCRCQPCRDRCAKVERERTAKKRAGTYRGKVPADPTRRHIGALLAAGTSQKDIMRWTGLSEQTILRVMSRGQATVHSSTERAVLAMKPVKSQLSGGRVDATGTRRRLQGLMWLGYSTVELSARLGVPRNAASRIMRETHVVAATRDAVAELFNELAMTPPPDSPKVRRARGFARKNGYVSHLVWDDIDTDPEPTLVSDVQEVRGLRVLEDAEWLLDQGETPEHVTKALGRTAGSLAKLARHHNRPDIATRFYALDRQERPAA